MQVELTRDEIETIIDAVDMWCDICIDTKNDLQGLEKAEQAEYIVELQGIISKLALTVRPPLPHLDTGDNPVKPGETQ